MSVIPYASQAELEARVAPEYLSMLADDNHDAVHDAIILTSAIERSSALINHLLSGRYQTPLATPSEVVKMWCIDLAVADLFERRREALPRELADRAALAMRALQSIADGLNNLSGAEPLPADFELASTTLPQDPTFTLRKLNLY